MQADDKPFTATVTSPPESTSSTTSSASAPVPKHPSSRIPPSLNQLAARISAQGNAPAPSSTSQAPSRPRLAAQLLRTGSQVSLASTATDSVAVNAPTTRSASPDTMGALSPAGSEPPFPIPAPSSVAGPVPADSGEPLTKDKIEKHNAELEKKGYAAPVGYKNIPSLDAITARMKMTRTLSIDGSLKPPEPETYEDPATPGIPQKKPEHPLENKWYAVVLRFLSLSPLSICISFDVHLGHSTTILKQLKYRIHPTVLDPRALQMPSRRVPIPHHLSPSIQASTKPD
jgi:translation initiation factor 4E